MLDYGFTTPRHIAVHQGYCGPREPRDTFRRVLDNRLGSGSIFLTIHMSHQMAGFPVRVVPIEPQVWVQFVRDPKRTVPGSA